MPYPRFLSRFSAAALVAATAVISAPHAHAQPYEVDYAASSVTFSGTHAGNPFSGIFAEWTADIIWVAGEPEQSGLRARFHTASAKTGNAMYDGTLPNSDWFDVKTHPTAEFVSDSITATDTNGEYEASGILTIRAITHPAQFRFTLSDVAQPPVTANGTLTIDRLAYDIGKKSDAGAEWVSQDITVTLAITANPQ